MITRENAKELLPILQAFAEGKQIQDKIEGVTDWVDTDEINFEYEGQKIKHRIKPEPKYRPFKSQEECWNEMMKHQPFGWIKCKGCCFNIVYVNNEYVGLADPYSSFISLASKNSYLDNTFLDGTPFGINIEEE